MSKWSDDYIEELRKAFGEPGRFDYDFLRSKVKSIGMNPCAEIPLSGHDDIAHTVLTEGVMDTVRLKQLMKDTLDVPSFEEGEHARWHMLMGGKAVVQIRELSGLYAVAVHCSSGALIRIHRDELRKLSPLEKLAVLGDEKG